MRAHRRFGLGLAAALLVHASGARADHDEAVRLFGEARKRVIAGHCDEALELLQKSLQAEPSVGALLNLGACEEQMGQLVRALRTFKRAEQLARQNDAERTEEAVRRQIALEARVGSVVVRPTMESEALYVDGVRVDAGERVLLEPGRHEIVASAADRPAARRAIDVVAGKHDVVIDAPSLPSAPSLPAPSPASAPSARGPRSEEGAVESRFTAGPWITGGAAAVALGIGAVSGIVAIHQRSDLTALCPSYPACPAAQLDGARHTEDRARTLATISTVSVVVGAALAATAIVWAVLQRRPPRVATALAF